MRTLMDLGQSVFAWTWETSVYATLLIVLVFALQEVLAKWLTPRLRYTLSLLVLVRLLLPSLPSSGLSYENFVPPVATLTSQAASLPVPDASTAVATPVRQPGAASLAKPAGAAFQISVSEISTCVWAAGCLGLLFLAGWRLGKWNRLVRAGRRISDARLLELLNASREVLGVRRRVELVAIDRLSSPAIFGLFRLRLLLPETVLQELNEEELRMIFLHELAHARRRDIPLNYLLMALQFLHWFNPLVWLALHRLRADQEMVCDALVMQRLGPVERRGYGQVLLKLVDGLETGKPVFSGAVPVVSGMAEIKRRILMIKNHRKASIAACVVTALTVVALALGVFTHGQPELPKPDSTPVDARKFLTGGPTYQGRTLGQWVTQMKQGNLKEQAAAREALHALGPKAVPYLVASLNNEDLWPQWRGYAASALGEIGPPASDAIPSLLRMSALTGMSNNTERCPATAALMRIRGEPIDGLIQALDGPSSEQRGAAEQTLAEFGTNAASAIPALCRLLGSENGGGPPNEPSMAAYAIGYIHSEPEIAVPALMDALKRSGSVSIGNENIVWALGEYEADASAAVPVLRQHLQDADPMARQAVLMSLRKILPPDEAETLVPALLQAMKDPEPNLSGVAQNLLREIDPQAAKKAGIKL